ncbi:hypothetical protein [Bifidobacterium moukalabense]|uniref:hypothetical protein n=1 Tax=Bifidobacterium moukalabense TaxID=1333651 RepID=UPI0010F95D56|nr:hypothetical protein [Bifidobacterium moukalabense]
MSKTMQNGAPDVKDFEAWTPEDEEKALASAAESMKVKHLIKGDSVWFLAPRGRVYRLPLALSIDDFDRLSKVQSDSEQVQVLKGMLEAFAGEQAAMQLSKEPVIVPINILRDYGAIISRMQGVGLGKSTTSSEPSKETAATA